MVVSLDTIRDLIRGFAKTGLWPHEICRSVSRYLARKRVVKLPLRTRLSLAVRGFYPVLTLKADSWGPLTFYIIKCSRHGLVVNYPHGYSQRLECPLCG